MDFGQKRCLDLVQTGLRANAAMARQRRMSRFSEAYWLAIENWHRKVRANIMDYSFFATRLVREPDTERSSREYFK